MPTKAYIEVTQGDSESEKFTVQYNPESLSKTESIKFAEKAGKDVLPIVEFTGNDNSELSFDLIFDTYYTKVDVRARFYKILKLLYMDASIKTVPQVKFVYGGIIFNGYLTQATQSYTLFDSDGTPLRCKLSITIKEMGDARLKNMEQLASKLDQSSSYSKTDGEELWEIASSEYDDESRWREVAEANDIDNPRKDSGNQSLTIKK